MDLPKLTRTATALLPPHRDLFNAAVSTNQLDEAISQLVKAIQQSVEDSTPWLRISEHSRTGFTPEARDTQRLAQRLRRQIDRLTRRGVPVPEDLQAAREVRAAVDRPAPDRAPGPDDIPNRVLQALAEHCAEFVPLLTDLFRHCLALGYCPAHFRETRTIALRKPGKPDYSVPKAYRRIALLNTVGKALESAIASRLSYLAETHRLLPPNHFGGRRGYGTDAALHTVVEIIHSVWKQGKVVFILYLDISGAFDNVSYSRLMHNLRKRGIPMEIVNWIESFLLDRYTTLVLPEYISPRARVNTGIL